MNTPITISWEDLSSTDDITRRKLAVQWAREYCAKANWTDPRSLAAIDTAERLANGKASLHDLALARVSAAQANEERRIKGSTAKETIAAELAIACAAENSLYAARCCIPMEEF